MDIKFDFQKVIKFSLFVACTLSIGGCGTGFMTYRDQNPLLEDHTHLDKDKVQVMATKASHRLAYITTEDTKAYVCAEPLPDVAETFNSTLSDALKVILNGEVPLGSLDATHNRNMATQNQIIYTPSHGVELYRMSMHELCMKRLNSKVKPSPSSNTNSFSLNPFAFSKPIRSSDNNYLLEDGKFDYERYYFDQSAEIINAEIALKKAAIEETKLKPVTPVPNFSFSQNTKKIATDSSSTGSLTVLVDKLKDESVVISIANASVLSAATDNGDVLAVKNFSVTVKNNASITFKLGNLNNGDNVVL